MRTAAPPAARRTRRSGSAMAMASRCARRSGARLPPGRRTQIDESAAADRALSGCVADDVSDPADRGGDRPVEHQLDVGRLARLDRIVAEQDDMRAHLGRGVMQPHRKPLADRLRLARQQAQPRVDAVRRRVQFGIEHHVAALDRVLGDASSAKLSAQRSPARPISAARFWACSERTRAGRPDGLITTRSPTCTDPDSTAPVTTTPTPGSVKTRSTARRNRASCRPVHRVGGVRDEAGAQSVHALARQRRNRQDVGALQHRSGGRRPDLARDLRQALGRRRDRSSSRRQGRV